MEPLLHHLLSALVLILPFAVGVLDLVLHVVKSLRQHLGEVRAQLIDTSLQIFDGLALRVHVLIDVGFKFLTLLLELIDLNIVVALPILEHIDLVGQVLLDGLELPGHIGDDVHLNFLLLSDPALKLKFPQPLLVLDSLLTISVLGLRQ